MQLIFATNNTHKIEEVTQALGGRFTIVSPKELGFEGDIPENQTTLEGNALEKARFIWEKFKQPCFADDTGLEVEALNNEPGVYSARYAGPGKNATDNMRKVLQSLQGKESRNARFRCVIALIEEGGHERLFEGAVEGHIIEHEIGTGGFGYDPIFIPNGYSCTFAEMPLDEKNKISHRGLAVTQLVDYLTKP